MVTFSSPSHGTFPCITETKDIERLMWRFVRFFSEKSRQRIRVHVSEGRPVHAHLALNNSQLSHCSQVGNSKFLKVYHFTPEFERPNVFVLPQPQGFRPNSGLKLEV